MPESAGSKQEYPDELLDAHRIEDGRLYTPVEQVIEGLEALLFETGTFEEMGDPYDLSRMQEYGNFIGGMHQKELYEEMENHPDSTISSAAKQIDPEYKPRTESTFECLRYLTQEMAPYSSMRE